MGQMVEENFFQKFYKKRVLVTGDTGFKGSWLCLWLAELGAEVVGLSLPPDDVSHFNLLDLKKLIKHIDCDIRDNRQADQCFSEFQPEIVFHLAAQALVRPSYEDPVTTFTTNFSGSLNILESVRRTVSVRSLVYVTSDKSYRNKEWIWGYRESDELGGHDPYSASKAAAELLLTSYQSSYFAKRPDIGVASVRAGNVIGGGDFALDRIVPDCYRHLSKSVAIPLRNPGSRRPWQHVLEPLHGYLKLSIALLDSPKQYSGAWNFGPHTMSVRTVQELAEKFVSYWGDGSLAKQTDEKTHHETGFLNLNWDKAYHELGWAPKWDFERTILETASWYKKFFDQSQMLNETKRQILAFMEAAAHD